MKTKNSKLQNSELESLTRVTVLVVAALLLSWQTIANEKITYYNSSVSVYAEISDNESETAMNLESWMFKENYFFFTFELEEAIETNLEIECWMTDATLFNMAYLLEEEVLKMEEWMMKEIYFSPAFDLEPEMEDTLELQSWMKNDSIFKTATAELAKTEALAMVTEEKTEKVITIEFKDATTGNIFLFRLAEVEEPQLQFEYWMFDRKLWIRR
jgi:hypothetical protein